MNKFTKVAAVALIALSPLMTLAFDGRIGGSANVGAGIGTNVIKSDSEINEDVNVNALGQVSAGLKNPDRDNDRNDEKDVNKNNKDEDNGQVADEVRLMGTVTATSTTGFTLKTEDGSVFTVNTGSAKLTQAFSGAITLADIMVNEKAEVSGSLNGSVISAERVVLTPANTHKAVGKGTVTAVGTNSFTVQANNHGIPSSFTVNTNASTTVTAANGTTSTLASIVVGTKVVVQGLWNEILNVLNAIRIHIR